LSSIGSPGLGLQCPFFTPPPSYFWFVLFLTRLLKNTNASSVAVSVRRLALEDHFRFFFYVPLNFRGACFPRLMLWRSGAKRDGDCLASICILN